MSDVETTEIVELEATKVAGVANPANGTPFLLLKAVAQEACTTCKGSGKILEGNRTCPDCKGSGNVTKAEIDEIEDELTKGAYCGDSTCEVCVVKEGASTRLRPGIKALSDKDRAKMPSSSFAYVDPKGGKHLPIHDEGHVKSALGRFSQQDFSEADDPAAAKKSAAKKIVAAAKKHGIEVDSKSTVAEAAKKGAIGPGVPSEALDEPKVAGHLDTGKSGLVGSLATDIAQEPTNAAQTLGGQSSYSIPLETQVTDNARVPLTLDAAGIVPSMAKTMVEFIEQAEKIANREGAIKAGKYLEFTPAQGDAAMSPGSMPWESYDAATLTQVAQCLAGCCNALDSIAQRERTEAATADPGDMENAWDLEEASQALEFALGVAARLSFHEASEGEATKAGRILSSKNESALAAACDHIQAVIDGAKSANADSPEEDEIMTTVTKDELAESIATASAAAAVEAVKQLRKQEKKDAKKAAEEAEKNSNPITQGGDISEADIKPTGTADADDVNAVGGSVDPKFVNKMEGQIAELSKSLASANETLAKIAKRPRSGGPVLTGQAPAGDQSQVTKEQVDGEIARLEKSLNEATDSYSRERLSEQLTYQRLLGFNKARGFPTG